MPPSEHPNDPLHGVTLKKMVTDLVDHFTWSGLGARIEIRCFTHDPSMGSSLKFLRKTPWARKKVENLYLDLIRYGALKPKDPENASPE